MNCYIHDEDYILLVSDILTHTEFQKLQSIVHHGNNRFDHSLRVSYFSYKIGKLLTLDYRKIARAALLHDFFFEENDGEGIKTKINTLMKHPKYALQNAEKYFELSELESDIIVTHMFPIAFRIPKYFESWLVDIVDDVVAVCEKVHVTRHQLSTAMSFVFFCFMNYLR